MLSACFDSYSKGSLCMMLHVVLYTFAFWLHFCTLLMGMVFCTFNTNRLLSAVLCRLSETLTMKTLPDLGRGPKLLGLENHAIF